MALTPLMLFYGSRADSVVPVSGGSPPVDSTSGFLPWNGTYSDSSLSANGGFYCPATDSTGAATSVGTGHTFYFHTCYSQSNATNGGHALIQLYDSSGFPWIQLVCPGSADVVQWQYNSNTGASPTWVNIGSAYVATGSPAIYDIIVTLNVSGTHNLQFVMNNSSLFTLPFTNINLTNLAKAGCYNNNNGGTGYSQMMITQDWSTVGAFVKTIRASGLGTYSQWSGTYTDVNEVVVSDATYNQATSNGLMQSYAMGDITLPAGFVIGGLRQCIRVKNDGATSPLNVDSLLRTAATDYTSANLPGVGVAFGPTGFRYDVNPDTSVAWTQAGINAVELGYVSAA